MSNAASHAHAFYREVAASRRLWTIQDKDGFPAPLKGDGERAQPFWSSRSRATRIIQNVSAYAGFEPVELSWDEFVARWIPDLTEDGIKVGVNWSGPRATGYDLDPEDVRRNVEAQREFASSS